MIAELCLAAKAPTGSAVEEGNLQATSQRAHYTITAAARACLRGQSMAAGRRVVAKGYKCEAYVGIDPANVNGRDLARFGTGTFIVFLSNFL